MKVAPEILSLTPYAPGKPISETKRELGLTDVIKLASNECPLPPPPRVVQALEQAAQEIHRYPDGGCYEMRQKVARYYGFDPSWIAFGNGSNELIDFLIRIYCEPGDEILTAQAAFIAYKISAQAARVHTVEVPLDAKMRFDLPAMREALKAHPKVRLIFLPNPNNPTGHYLSKAELTSFLEGVKDKDVLVVLDEAYLEFVRAEDYPNGADLIRAYPNVCLLRTMSKVFGLAGLRVGTLLARPNVIDLVQRVRNPFNVNSMAQAAVCAVLEEKEFLSKIQQLTWEGLDYFYEQLDRMELSYCPSQANFVLFDVRQDATSVFERLLREGVILRPVKNYGLPMHLRMSVGLPAENERAIRALQKVLGSKRAL